MSRCIKYIVISIKIDRNNFIFLWRSFWMGNVEQRTNYYQLCSNNEKFPGKEDRLQIKQKLNLLNLHMYNAYFCDAQ